MEEETIQIIIGMLSLFNFLPETSNAAEWSSATPIAIGALWQVFWLVLYDTFPYRKCTVVYFVKQYRLSV